jgi:ribosome-binding protein aMBF1 (putative translation factor)
MIWGLKLLDHETLKDERMNRTMTRSGSKRKLGAAISMAIPTGPEIRKAREDRSISLRELALKAKISYQAILRWETGKAKPHPRTIRQVIAALQEIPIIGEVPGLGESPKK